MKATENMKAYQREYRINRRVREIERQLEQYLNYRGYKKTYSSNYNYYYIDTYIDYHVNYDVIYNITILSNKGDKTYYLLKGEHIRTLMKEITLYIDRLYFDEFYRYNDDKLLKSNAYIINDNLKWEGGNRENNLINSDIKGYKEFDLYDNYCIKVWSIDKVNRQYNFFLETQYEPITQLNYRCELYNDCDESLYYRAIDKTKPMVIYQHYNNRTIAITNAKLISHVVNGEEIH